MFSRLIEDSKIFLLLSCREEALDQSLETFVYWVKIIYIVVPVRLPALD
jgi:hypothetical protein